MTRRTDALSRERIVEAAVALLDAAGEAGLTFKALTERLATGPGAVYHHVANREELLAACTDAVVSTALRREPEGGSPAERIRAVALGLFDTIDEHPWLAAQLSTSSYQSASPTILESFGQQVDALGVPKQRQFAATSVLVEYVLGAASQNAVNGVLARRLDLRGREEHLAAAAQVWSDLDPRAFPFTTTVADQFRDHDDREQFLNGIDIVVAGIAAVHPPARRSRR